MAVSKLDGEEIEWIVICRDIPGDHIGGRECFCCPEVIHIDDHEAWAKRRARGGDEKAN